MCESYAAYKNLRNGPNGHPRQTPHIRHLQSCNVGFFDGRAAAVGRKWLHDHKWDYWYYWNEFVYAQWP